MALYIHKKRKKELWFIRDGTRNSSPGPPPCSHRSWTLHQVLSSSFVSSELQSQWAVYPFCGILHQKMHTVGLLRPVTMTAAVGWLDVSVVVFSILLHLQKLLIAGISSLSTFSSIIHTTAIMHVTLVHFTTKPKLWNSLSTPVGYSGFHLPWKVWECEEA